MSSFWTNPCAKCLPCENSAPEEGEQPVGCNDAIALRPGLAHGGRDGFAFGIKQIELRLHADADLMANAVPCLRSGKGLLTSGGFDQHGGSNALKGADRLFIDGGPRRTLARIGSSNRAVGFGDLRRDAPTGE